MPPDAVADVSDLLESILHGIITQETEQAVFEEKLRRVDQDHSSTRISHALVNGKNYLCLITKTLLINERIFLAILFVCLQLFKLMVK